MQPTKNDTPLDAVLDGISALEAIPDQETIRSLIDQYPQYRSEIIDFVTDWIEMEATLPKHPVSESDINSVVNRTMSRVQAMLREEDESPPIESLVQAIEASGNSLESFVRQVGIDRTMLTSINSRRILLETVPKRLLQRIADVIGISLRALMAYLERPPRQANAYMSTKPPSVERVKFSEVVRESTLTEDEKRRWLAVESADAPGER